MFSLVVAYIVDIFQSLLRISFRRFILTACLLFTGSVVFLQTGPWAGEDVDRYPFVSGSFYPSDKDELSLLVDDFLSKAPSENKNKGELVCLILPHAGYIYSGQTAAFGYKLLAGRAFDTVILIGPYHKALFEGASIWRAGSWQTPLGEVPVDADLADSIIKEDEAFGFSQDAHAAEHSLEAQVPFLQKVLKDFKIVPILISNASAENTARLAKAVFKNIQGKKVLVIASSDMSHYYSDESARQMDNLTLDFLRSEDADGLLEALRDRRSELCGSAAVLTVLEIARLIGHTQTELLNYSNTGDVTHDKSRVVGYGALAIYKGSGQETPVRQSSEALSAKQRQTLLKIARKTVEAYVGRGEIPEFDVKDPVLKENRAAFVTLRKYGNLRGCIGSLIPTEPLYLAVRNKAIQAATEDPRFKPVQPYELEHLKVEVSVLSIPQKIQSTDQIELGKNGVIVKKDGRSGVFLPQVATETGWSKEEFLNELCSQKAGLPPDCWKDPTTELYTFTAEEFGED